MSFTAQQIQALQSPTEEITKVLAEEIKNEIDGQVLWEMHRVMHPDWTHVTLPDRSSPKWKEYADWMIETFGPPTVGEGARYIVHSTRSEMKILFKHEADAIRTILRWK
jgi:hypothetical protein